MRIGIDARMLGQGFGLARYLQQLVLHLEQLDTTNEYVLFMRRENWNEYEPQSSRFQKILADIPWYTWKEQREMPKYIAAQDVDLMHFPHWNVPLGYKKPFVVTIHDLTMYHYPRPDATTLGPVKYWMKDRVHRHVVAHAVKCAKAIVTTSEFTKHDVHETLNVPKEKMTVTYQAPFHIRTKKKPCAADIDALCEKYGIIRPYVLYVGAAYPHKNLSGLLAAWHLFEEQYDTGSHHLVLAGKHNEFYRRLLVDSDALYRCNRASYIGFIPDEELAQLYAGAHLFVFPSLYEGFGIPPLEALAAGVPVVSSNRSSLPEVLGEGALYVDPENIAQFAEGVHRALTDEDLRAELYGKGREELRRFSWETLAKQTLAVYEASVG